MQAVLSQGTQPTLCYKQFRLILFLFLLVLKGRCNSDRRKKVNKSKWLLRANHPKEAEELLNLRPYRPINFSSMNSNWREKQSWGSRRLPNHQKLFRIHLSKPVSYRAAFSPSSISLLGEKSARKLSMLRSQDITRAAILIQPTRVPAHAPGLCCQPAPTPCRPPVAPASAQGKMGGGQACSQTPTPQNITQHPASLHARSGRLRRLSSPEELGLQLARALSPMWSDYSSAAATCDHFTYEAAPSQHHCLSCTSLHRLCLTMMSNYCVSFRPRLWGPSCLASICPNQVPWGPRADDYRPTWGWPQYFHWNWNW